VGHIGHARDFETSLWYTTTGEKITAEEQMTAPAQPSQEHMLGHGFYNKHAQAQGAANELGLHLIRQAVDAIDVKRTAENFRIADYGCAQGHNSLLPIKTALEEIKTRWKPFPATFVFHTDLPTNDWTTLFQTVLDSPDSYMVGATNVSPFASAISIYKQIFPAERIALGYSAITTHWLSRKPGNIPNHILSTRATGAAHDVWAKQAHDDWYAFLQYRASELLSSGQMVMINSGAAANGNCGAEPLLDAANRVLQQMVKGGTLGADEYANMAIPTYYRVEREWREPFQDAAFLKTNPLKLLHYQEIPLEDVYLNQYDDLQLSLPPKAGETSQVTSHDANTFAKADSAFFLAAFEPSLFVSLRADRDAASKQQVIDTFTQMLQTTLAQKPDAYPARWMLQIMLIAKT
jgi:hypothetical protein